MKSKRILCVLLTLTVAVIGVSSLADSNSSKQGMLYDAYVEYDLAKQYNDEIYVEKQKQYKEQIVALENKLLELEDTEKEEINKQKEIIDAVEVTTEYETITAEGLYDIAVKSAKDNGTSVERFYTFNEDNIYTIQIKGLFRDLNTTINDFQKTVENNNVSIGNMSIRQDYDAYNLEREFDDKSMLNWYNNEIVNVMGDVIDLSDLVIENQSDGDVDYTLMTLDDVKLDTESINREVAASNKRIDEEIAQLVLDYGKQIDIIVKSDYDIEVKAELRANIDTQHEEAKEKLIELKDIRKAEIETKYQKIYEKDRAKVADAIFHYNKKLVELKATLADSSQLEYTMTFTVRVE